MIPSRSLWESTQDLLAADTEGLASVSANKVALVIAPFTPSIDLDITSLTLATFTGSAPKSAGTGTQTVYYDPLTGTRAVQVLEPAGGWTFKCTATPGSPETVYGYILTDNAGTVLLASALLPTAVPISVSGQAVDIPPLRLDFLTNSPR